MRLVHITRSAPNPSHFTVLVRSIPYSIEGSLSDSVKSFFTKYHASSYLSHQMIYRVGKVQTLLVRDMLYLSLLIYFSFSPSCWTWCLVIPVEFKIIV